MAVVDGSVFVDTGAWYALGDDSEQDHAAALAVWQRLTSERVTLVTSNFVVAETHALAIRRRGRDQALIVLRGILDGTIRIERVAEADEMRAVAIMERRKIETAFAFDRHLAQFGRTTLGLDG